MKEIYLLSGLGADQRVFDFLDLSAYQVNYINWIAPDKNESIEQYASRLTRQIHTTDPILIGVSFGGMMAIEMGKLIPAEKIILISSAKTRTDIPFYYRIAGSLRLNKLMPQRLLKSVNVITYWFFGVESIAEKKLLKAIIRDTDFHFLKWAIHQIVNWKNETVLKNVYQIHGTNDRLLPYRSADVAVPSGHLMIVNRAQEIDKALFLFMAILITEDMKQLDK